MIISFTTPPYGRAGATPSRHEVDALSRLAYESAGSPGWPLLEALLRQFEYDADTAGPTPTSRGYVNS